MKENHNNFTDQKPPLRGGLEGLCCLIVEDEPLPRLALQAKLETYHPDVQILDMCDSAEDALESILRHKPQLLFLDIQLPGKNSLWLIEQLEKVMKLPLIIFTTAFTDPEYLIKAIKISAVDYLQKPVNLIELSQALEKARKVVARATSDTGKDERAEPQTYSFKAYNSLLLLASDDIVYIEADGNYSQLRTVSGKLELVFERLGEIDDKICGKNFIRAGRSLILNRKYIHKINLKDDVCIVKANENTYNFPLSHGALSQVKTLLTENSKM